MNPAKRAELLSLINLEQTRRDCEQSLAAFVREAWPVIEPGVDYIHGWHIDLICEHLEAVTSGQIQRLLINIPPRHAKSTLVDVLWPCWEWTTAPWQKYLCASYSGILSTRDSIKCRRLILSPWYQKMWGNVFKLSGDQNQKTRFENDCTGYRIASSVGGTATGEGGSRLVLDDPHGAQEAQSQATRESALEWFDGVWSTRLNNPKKDAMVTIMQRLHEKDISGRILELGGWEHLCLPAEWDGKSRKSFLGPYDDRKQVGELLWPDRFGHEELDRIKNSLGEYSISGQLQQQPTPSGGGLLKPAWFALWPKEQPLPIIEYLLQSYDTAFTEKTHGDPTACSVWGVFSYKNTMNVLLLDCWAERLAYPDLRARVLADYNAQYGGDVKDPMNKARRPDIVLVEEKGSGMSLLQDLRQAKVPVASYNPGRADKVSRAHTVAPVLESGIVWVPEGKKGNVWVSWANKFMTELSHFPRGEHDDYVDTLTQALRYLRDRGFLGMVETKRLYEDIERPKKKRINPYAV